MEALTLFMADSVRQEINGKLIAVGMYFNVKLRGGPSDNVSEVAIFATLTGLPEGEHDVRVVIASHDTEALMEPDSIKLTSAGENQIYPVNFRIPDFSFPGSGNYAYQILVDDAEVAANLVSVKFEREEPISFENAELESPTE